MQLTVIKSSRKADSTKNKKKKKFQTIVLYEWISVNENSSVCRWYPGLIQLKVPNIILQMILVLLYKWSVLSCSSDSSFLSSLLIPILSLIHHALFHLSTKTKVYHFTHLSIWYTLIKRGLMKYMLSAVPDTHIHGNWNWSSCTRVLLGRIRLNSASIICIQN